MSSSAKLPVFGVFSAHSAAEGCLAEVEFCFLECFMQSIDPLRERITRQRRGEQPPLVTRRCYAIAVDNILEVRFKLNHCQPSLKDLVGRIETELRLGPALRHYMSRSRKSHKRLTAPGGAILVPDPVCLHQYVRPEKPGVVRMVSEGRQDYSGQGCVHTESEGGDGWTGKHFHSVIFLLDRATPPRDGNFPRLQHYRIPGCSHVVAGTQPRHIWSVGAHP